MLGLFVVLQGRAGAVDLSAAAAIVANNDVAQPNESDIPIGSPEAFDAWLVAVDPYARRETAVEAEALRAPHQGETGIGGRVFATGGVWRWVAYRSGPAVTAGVPSEGELVGVNETPLDPKLNRARLVEILKAGGPVARLRFENPPGVFKVRQAPVFVPSVESWKVGQTVVVRVFTFTPGVTARALREAIGTSASVVLDLRFSEGGAFLEAVDAAGVFLAPGTRVAGLVSATGDRRWFVAPDGGTQTMRSLSVLTSPVTASSAEVLAAALRTGPRVRVVGTQTLGKCSAQKMFALPDGGRLWLSVDWLIRPSGADCREEPLTPDVAMPQAQVFDTEWLLAAAGALEWRSGEVRVCERATQLSPIDGWQRDIELRTAIDLPPVASRLVPMTIGDVTGYRVCFGPLADRDAGSALATQLTTLAGMPFDAATD